MIVSKKIDDFIVKSAAVRKMFEEGARLKEKLGAENVFDFSIGNPSLEPPQEFFDILSETVKSGQLGAHGYTVNAGISQTRRAIAEYVSKEQGITITEDDIVMTGGAAGALNVIFKTVLDPNDEVLVPTPCFVEYGFHVDNHGGILKPAKTNPDFTLDLEAIEAAITSKTKVMLINSPNNPTGQIYSQDSLNKLGELLEEKSKEYDRTIFLVSDEPYRKLIFDGVTVPSIFLCYSNSIVVTSYSKDLSIPGERIGFLTVNPMAKHKAKLIDGFCLVNRILGFISAPALMQRVVARLQGISVDIFEYDRKRKLLCDGLADCGYEFTQPLGTFYLFPRTPIEDDVEFVQALAKEKIMAVGGTAFRGPGHFRLAFCVDDETIINALPGFKRVMDHYK